MFKQDPKHIYSLWEVVNFVFTSFPQWWPTSFNLNTAFFDRKTHAKCWSPTRVTWKTFKIKEWYSWKKNIYITSFTPDIFFWVRNHHVSLPPKKKLHLLVLLRPEKWSQTWPNVVQFLGNEKISQWDSGVVGGNGIYIVIVGVFLLGVVDE